MDYADGRDETTEQFSLNYNFLERTEEFIREYNRARFGLGVARFVFFFFAGGLSMLLVLVVIRLVLVY